MYLFISFESRGYRIQGLKKGEKIIESQICDKKIGYHCDIDKFYRFEKRLISKNDDSDLFYLANEICENIKNDLDLKAIKKIIIIYQRADIIFKAIEIGKNLREKDIKDQIELEFSRDMKLDLNKYSCFHDMLKKEDTYDVILVKLVPNYLYELARNIERYIGKKISNFIIEEEIIECEYKGLINTSSVGGVLRIGKTDLLLCTVDSGHIKDVMLIDKKEVEDNFVSYIKSIGNLKVLVSYSEDMDSDFLLNLGLAYDSDYNAKILNRILEDNIHIKSSIFYGGQKYRNILDYRSEKLFYYNLLIGILVFFFFINLFKLPSEYGRYLDLKERINSSISTGVDRSYRDDRYKHMYKNICGVDVMNIEKILDKIKSPDLLIDGDMKAIKAEFSVSSQKELSEMLSMKLNKKIKIEEIKKEEHVEEIKKAIDPLKNKIDSGKIENNKINKDKNKGKIEEIEKKVSINYRVKIILN